MRKTGRRRRGRAVLALLTAFLILGLAVLIWILASAPEISTASVSPHGYRTTVLDDRGETILTLAGPGADRVYVTLEQIPRHLQDAFVAIEDERFWSHKGVDLRGIARALLWDIASGSLSQGGSTITQQLIKNNVFEAGMGEETARDKIVRKIQEQWLALRLERRTSKSWILENYLNTIDLGSGSWGVQTAAQRYFGKDVSDLTLAECAAVAGITRSPAAYSPLRHPDRCRQRQLLVLGRMRDLGMISEEERAAAAEEDLWTGLGERAASPGGPEVFSWFEDAVVSRAAEDLQTVLGLSEDEAWQRLYRGGLTIETTQDSALQWICEEEAERAGTDAQTAIVMIDPGTGAVKAVVGGRGEKTASLLWDRALSGPRQPGSTIKIVGQYAEALESGAAGLATVFDDAPTSYADGGAIRNAGGSYLGRTTVREAIVRSLNTVALRCFRLAGEDAVRARLDAFGFRHLDEDGTGEALALGGTHGGVTVLELTAAYAAIAHGGVWTAPYLYTRILDRDGAVLLETVPEERQAVRPSTALLLTSAMEDVMSRGTGTEAAFPGMSLAGKSGTTTDRRDLWFVGFSPVLACGVWMGHDDLSPQESSSPVKQLWRALMERAHEGIRDPGFPPATALEVRTVCDKCGLLAVPGLCGDTVQGDRTREERFAPGTAPVRRCNCHVKVAFCAVSGERAGLYCRDRTEQVWLRQGTPGTADEEAVWHGGAACSVHRTWIDWLRPEERAEEEADPPPPDLPPASPEDGAPSEEGMDDPDDPGDPGDPGGETGRSLWTRWKDWIMSGWDRAVPGRSGGTAH